MTQYKAAEFALVQAALRAWPDVRSLATTASTPVRRLLHAMEDAVSDPQHVGPPDLAALLRHVLRAEAESSGTNKALTVPIGRPWPVGADWQMHGITAHDQDHETQVVVADPWQPGWLDLPEARDPAAAAFRGSTVEPLGDVPRPKADPFFAAATENSAYRSSGQREAVRAVLASSREATIIGNLPTGTGKSLVGYIPSLVGPPLGTTLFVVPTTSLALDQERAYRELVMKREDASSFPHEFAYHGDLDDGVRQEFRRRISDGTQKMLFTSPESLGASLSHAVYVAAERGLIRAFVIDEAHIVSQWGAEFRPAFQAMAGLRSDLLSVAQRNEGGFKTVILSATLTNESLLTLQGLFGRPGPTDLISSVALRHEPSYWIADSDSDEARTHRVFEAIEHLPRPLVLYTTRVEDAKRWHNDLRQAGHRRVALVAGSTSASDRRDAIDRLRAQALDIVVGTSAFGLGVDQPDMRAVIHACLPETLDRFYQEVGRGGRDGRPSLSLLLTAPQDRPVADSLAHRKLIGLERGFERWKVMQTFATSLEGRLRVPLSVSPDDIEGDSLENRAWNTRTLLLMDRAGLISLDAMPPPRRSENESQEEWEMRVPSAFDDYAEHAVVNPLIGTHADQGVWEAAVSDARNQAKEADRESRSRMSRAMRPGEQVCRLFADTYSVTQSLPGISDQQVPIPVAASCGGCPGCRDLGLPPRRFPPPSPLPARNLTGTWEPRIQKWFGGAKALAVTYKRDDQWPESVTRAIERLVRLGAICISAPDELLSNIWNSHRLAPGRVVFMLDRWNPLIAPSLPTVLVRSPGERISGDDLENAGSQRVVFVPDDSIDPRHGSELVASYHPAVTSTADIVANF